MKRFKRSLKIRIGLLALLALTAGGVTAFSLCGGGQALPGFIRGFQLGFAAALTGAGACMAVWYSRLLTDPERLQLRYNKEMDERMKAIRAKAGMPMLNVTSLLMIVVGMVGSYWRPMTFCILVLAGTFQLLASMTVMAVYLKIM